MRKGIKNSKEADYGSFQNNTRLGKNYGKEYQKIRVRKFYEFQKSTRKQVNNMKEGYHKIRGQSCCALQNSTQNYVKNT